MNKKFYLRSHIVLPFSKTSISSGGMTAFCHVFKYDHYVDFRTLNFKDIIRNTVIEHNRSSEHIPTFVLESYFNNYDNLFVKIEEIDYKTFYDGYDGYDYKLRITKKGDIYYYYAPNDDLKIIKKNNNYKGFRFIDSIKRSTFDISDFNDKFKTKFENYMKNNNYELALSALKKIVPTDDYKLEIKSLENKIKEGL